MHRLSFGRTDCRKKTYLFFIPVQIDYILCGSNVILFGIRNSSLPISVDVLTAPVVTVGLADGHAVMIIRRSSIRRVCPITCPARAKVIRRRHLERTGTADSSRQMCARDTITVGTQTGRINVAVSSSKRKNSKWW